MKKIILLTLIASLVTMFQEPCLAQDSIEKQLAIINAGTYVSSNDISIKRFKYLLQAIQRKTNVSPKLSENGNVEKNIAAQVVAMTTAIENRRGIKINLLEFMEGFNDFLNNLSTKEDFSEALALYATFYELNFI